MTPQRSWLALLLAAVACTGSPPAPDASPDRALDLTVVDREAPPDVTAEPPPHVAPDAASDDLAPPPPDAASCGAAGQRCCDGAACAPPLVCRDGACRPCPDDFAACDGACRDVTRDAANCGGCGRACRADQRCAMGACVCAEGRSSCGGACVDVQRDDAHCGRCGHACAGRFPGATARCELGRCVPAACDEGRGDCDGDASNGCEVTLASSMLHCGRCGGRCDALPGRGVSCQEGRCVDAMTCAAGLADCTPAPGCETDPARSVAYCGACGASCSGRGGVARCVAGTCAITCDAGFGDCDGDAGNGCEVALTGDAAHCGGCGRRCARAAATAVCAMGRCAIGRCAEGRGDCDGDDANGCEADLTDDIRHCGACRRACRSDQTCAAGVCACRVGAVVCGDECVDTRSDARHCGACGVVCGSGICSEGVCTTAATQRSCMTAGTPGCGLVEVAAGRFSMGTPASCVGWQSGVLPDPRTCADMLTDPVQPDLAISALAVDAYEVTVARFRAFVRVRAQVLSALRARPVTYPGGQEWPWETLSPLPQENAAACPYWCTWTAAPGSFESFPVLGADPWLAQEFCVWDGGRLPTEAEWEYVARGRAVPAEGLLPGRTYPWGEAVPVAMDRCDRGHVPSYCNGEGGTYYRLVGRYAPTGGVYDLAGNAPELCADHFTPFSTFYPLNTCWRGVSVRDPMCRTTARSRTYVSRGEVFPSEGVRGLRAASRGMNSSFDRLGFRCVRSRP